MTVALITVFFASGEPAKTFEQTSHYCFDNRRYIEQRIVADSQGVVERVSIQCVERAN